jgi:RES domain-containing protein
MASTPDHSAWRIDDAKWSSISTSGRGAFLFGGRWNSPGISVIYASQHLAMAAYEKFIHIPKPLPPGLHFVKFAIRFHDLPILHKGIADMPSDWRKEPVPASTQAIGDAWIKGLTTAILAVPSVLIPEETNFLINPSHPDFSKVHFSSATVFEFDLRLAHLRGAKS